MTFGQLDCEEQKERPAEHFHGRQQAFVATGLFQATESITLPCFHTSQSMMPNPMSSAMHTLPKREYLNIQAVF